LFGTLPALILVLLESLRGVLHLLPLLGSLHFEPPATRPRHSTPDERPAHSNRGANPQARRSWPNGTATD
jgi:hypothetical protein